MKFVVNYDFIRGELSMKFEYFKGI